MSEPAAMLMAMAAGMSERVAVLKSRARRARRSAATRKTMPIAIQASWSTETQGVASPVAHMCSQSKLSMPSPPFRAAVAARYHQTRVPRSVVPSLQGARARQPRGEVAHTLDEAGQERLGVRLHGDVEVGRLATGAAPVGDRLAGGEDAAQLHVHRQRLGADQARVEGGGQRQRIVDEGAEEAVVAAVELHIEAQRIGEGADDGRAGRERGGLPGRLDLGRPEVGEDDRRRVGIDADVPLCGGRGVARGAVRAAHDHQATQQERQLRIADAPRPVRLRRRREGPHQRRFAPQRHFDVRAIGQLQDRARVHSHLPRVDVARHAGGGHELHLRRGARVEEGQGIVDAGVDVEDDGVALGHARGSRRTTSIAHDGTVATLYAGSRIRCARGVQTDEQRGAGGRHRAHRSPFRLSRERIGGGRPAPASPATHSQGSFARWLTRRSVLPGPARGRASSAGSLLPAPATRCLPGYDWRMISAQRHRVTVIPGDGVGPEVTRSAMRVIELAGVAVDWEEAEAGAEVFRRGDSSGVPNETRDSIERTRVVLKGPLETPIGFGEKSANVTLRKLFETYANVRPARELPGVPTRYAGEGVDMVIVRENVEDLYAGIEHMQTPDVGQCLKIISRKGSEKVIRYAFELARREGRTKVTCATKANIMKLTEGLFKRVFEEMAPEYPEIEPE